MKTRKVTFEVEVPWLYCIQDYLPALIVQILRNYGIGNAKVTVAKVEGLPE